MGKKRLQRLVLWTAVLGLLGYVSYLGGCDAGKIRNFYNRVCRKTEQTYDLAQRTYKEGEKLYNQAEPHVRKMFEDKKDKEISQEEKDKKEEKRKTLSSEVVIG